MKIALSLLLILCTSALASDEGAYFGLKGKVTVKTADMLMDGGSTFVTLQDEDGSLLSIRYGSDLFTKENYAGWISIRLPDIKGSYLLQRGGPEMQTLVALLREASNSTFGTDDFGKRDMRRSVEAMTRSLTRLGKQGRKSKTK